MALMPTTPTEPEKRDHEWHPKPPTTEGSWKPRWYTTLALSVQLALGAFTVVWEVVTPGERPVLIFASLGLLGAAPITAALDFVRQGKGR